MYFEIYRQGSAPESAAGADDGSWSWNLKATNDETIARGQSYADKADCLRAVYLVRGTNCNETPLREV